MLGMDQIALIAAGPLIGTMSQHQADRVADDEGINVRHRQARYLIAAGLGAAAPIWMATLPGQVQLAGCILGWLLLAITMVDWATMLIPRWMTSALVLSGLTVTWVLTPHMLYLHAVAALLGWMSFFLIRWVYQGLRGKGGLGAGDAFLIASSGAWVGLAALPGLVVIAAAMGLVAHCASATVTRSGISLAHQMPFGPFLAIATWLTWTVGPLQFG